MSNSLVCVLIIASLCLVAHLISRDSATAREWRRLRATIKKAREQRENRFKTYHLLHVAAMIHEDAFCPVCQLQNKRSR